MAKFKPGESGNPNGRPKGTGGGRMLTTIMKEMLDIIPEGQKETYKHMLITNTLRKAIQGDKVAMKLVWNYIDGLPKATIDLNTELTLNKEDHQRGIEAINDFLNEK